MFKIITLVETFDTLGLKERRQEQRSLNPQTSVQSEQVEKNVVTKMSYFSGKRRDDFEKGNQKPRKQSQELGRLIPNK